MTVRAMIELIAKDSASSAMKSVDGALEDLTAQAATSASSISRSMDQMQKSMDSLSGPSAKTSSFDFAAYDKRQAANTRETLEQEQSYYEDYYKAKEAMAQDDASLQIRQEREEEWAASSAESISKVEDGWDRYIDQQKAAEAELAANWRERAQRAADEFILEEERAKVKAETAEVEARIDKENKDRQQETRQLLIEASRADLLRGQAEINVANQSAKAKRDNALASEEIAVKYGEQARSLFSVIDSTIQYSESVSDVTKGSTGFIATLGNVAVAAKTVAGSDGTQAVIAGLDLMRIGYGAIIPIMAQAVSMAYSSAEAFTQNADSSSDAAAIIGSNVREYSSLSDAITLVGEDTDRIQQGVTAMSFRMREAIETNGELQGAMGRYGVSLTDANGIVKTSTSLLLEYADVFAAMPAGPQKTAAAMQIFGRGGAALIPVLDQGSAALKRQMGIAEGLGATYTELDGAVADGLLAAQGRISVFEKAVGNAIGRSVTPTLTGFLNVVADIGTEAFVAFSDGASGMTIRLAQLRDSAKASTFSALGDEVQKTAKDIDALTDSYEESNRAAAESADYSEDRVAAFRKSADEAKEEVNVRLDALNVTLSETQAQRDALNAIENKNLATREAISAADETIAKTRAIITEKGGETQAYREHVQALQDAKEAVKGFREEQQVEIKSEEAIRAKRQEIFQERVKYMVEAKSDAEDMSLAIARANRAVLEAEGKNAEERAVVSQKLALARLAAENSVFDEEVRLAAQRQNIALEVERAQTAAVASTLKAETDFQIDRATVSEQSKQARVAAERAVFDEGVKTDQLRQNSALNVARGIKAAETKLVSDQQALDVARATSFETLASKRVAVAQAIFDAEMALEEARQNRTDEIAKRREEGEKALFDAETDIIAKRANADQQIASDRLKVISDITDLRIQKESLFQTASLRTEAAIEQAELNLAQVRQSNDEARATRNQQIAAAREQVVGQIIAQETQISVIQQQAADKQLQAIIARRNAELDVANKTLQIAQIKAQLADRDMLRAEARKDAELQEYTIKLQSAQAEEQKIAYSERGLSLAQACTQSFGQMNVAAQGVAVTVGQITQGLMETVKQTAQLSGQLGSIIQGPGGGPSGALTINGETIGLPQQGLPGAAGMEAAQLYQNRLANARALEEAQKRNEEQKKIADAAQAVRKAQEEAADARLTEAQRDRKRLQQELDERKKSIDLESQNGDLRLELMRLDTQSQINSTKLQTQFTTSADKLLLQQKIAQLGLQNAQTQGELGQFSSIRGLLEDQGVLGLQSSINSSMVSNAVNSSSIGQYLLLQQKSLGLQGGINSTLLDIRANNDPAYASLLQKKAQYDEVVKRQQDAFSKQFGANDSKLITPFSSDGREPVARFSDSNIARIVQALEKANLTANIAPDRAGRALAPTISKLIKNGDLPVSSRGLVSTE